jgi:hypothetical protein
MAGSTQDTRRAWTDSAQPTKTEASLGSRCFGPCQPAHPAAAIFE